MNGDTIETMTISELEGVLLIGGKKLPNKNLSPKIYKSLLIKQARELQRKWRMNNMTNITNHNISKKGRSFMTTVRQADVWNPSI